MSKKAQLSSEFIVILGVVLIVAMVAIGLTLLFSQASRDITENEARAYWASQPQPLRMPQYEGYYGATAGQLAILIENVDTKPITLRGFVIEPGSGSGSITDEDGGELGELGAAGLVNPPELAPSEKKIFYIATNLLCTGSGIGTANADFFENDFTLYYDTPYFTGLSFKGVKSIKGGCSS
ncbi:MAG: hypothetical protein V1822_04035 [Candidatus Micrarchaeota archaeon]